jgi:GAF domain-containing protein/tRNA A-37 threonylcarbamoyl transferase component Bud32
MMDDSRPRLAQDDASVELSPGQVLDGKYEVDSVLGAGSMGTVYGGHHILLGRRVAIKVVRLADQANDETEGRFLAEGRVLASLAHPHVVQIHDLGLVRGTPYLVMEHLEGETLHERIARSGPLPIEEARVIARQILAALSAVHRLGIVHRDLKPANVFLASSRDRVPHSKLLDFGVSTHVLTDTATLAGTPAYFAPEQASIEAVDASTDIWAMGVTLYQMLTGQLPFLEPRLPALLTAIREQEPLSPRVIRPEIPPAIEGVVMRALQKRKDARFPDAETMRDALADEEAPITARGGTTRAFALIAEPDPHVAEIYGAYASELDLVPAHAGDGAEAAELFASVGAPRLLIANLGLPVLDGFALVSRLRKMAPPSVSAAVAVSTVSALRAAGRERRSDLGLAAVLDPTLPPDLVKSALRRALMSAPVESAPETTATVATEKRRLDRVAAMNLVDDQPPDGALQRLVADTARAFDVPVALISIMLGDRQWYKAHFGLGGELLARRSAPREHTFCQHVVESGTPLVVPDARSHPVFAQNRYVQEGAVGSYVGAPLTAPSGEVLGTLCIFDKVARPISRDKVEDLIVLARRVAGELEVRARPPERAKRGVTTRTSLQAVLANLDSAVLLLGPDRRVIFANPQLAAIASVPVESLIGLWREACFLRIAEGFADPGDFLRRTRVPPNGPFVGREDFAVLRPAPGRLRWTAKPADLDGKVGHLETFTEITASG